MSREPFIENLSFELDIVPSAAHPEQQRFSISYITRTWIIQYEFVNGDTINVQRSSGQESLTENLMQRGDERRIEEMARCKGKARIDDGVGV